MRAADNPFTPGSGLLPPALVGRDADLEALDIMIDRVHNGLPNRGMVLTGLRGVGKTVLLNEMQRRTEEAGWFVVKAEARADTAGAATLRRNVARSMVAQARALAVRSPRERIQRALQAVQSFSVSLGMNGVDLGVTRQHGRADSKDLEIDLPELVEDVCTALDGTALALFLDEMQDVDAEMMGALLYTQHEAGQRGWPFYVIGAGLPPLPGILAEIRSYAERLFDYRQMGKLIDPDDARALVDPVTTRKAWFTSESLGILREAAGGYPYFLQEYGRAVWETAPGPEITATDAHLAVALGRERLDSGFFASRWSRATPSERRLLVAMAEDGDGPSATGTVAQRLGLRTTSLGPARAALISKGLIYAPEHGLMAYTVPGMADYVRRNREDA